MCATKSSFLQTVTQTIHYPYASVYCSNAYDYFLSCSSSSVIFLFRCHDRRCGGSSVWVRVLTVRANPGDVGIAASLAKTFSLSAPFSARSVFTVTVVRIEPFFQYIISILFSAILLPTIRPTILSILWIYSFRVFLFLPFCLADDRSEKSVFTCLLYQYWIP